MHASESHYWNDITESHLASFAQEYPGEFITPTFYCFTFLENVFGGGKTCKFCKITQGFDK
ncbi:hypothetical protein Hanom_Chr17g01589801 [Helianthus anomalus]